jgi:hypothetical protein
MIEGQEVMERVRLLSVEGLPTKADLAQTCMSVVFSFSVWYSFCNAVNSETAGDHLANRCGPPVVRGPQFEKHCRTLQKRLTVTLSYCEVPKQCKLPVCFCAYAWLFAVFFNNENALIDIVISSNSVDGCDSFCSCERWWEFLTNAKF